MESARRRGFDLGGRQAKSKQIALSSPSRAVGALPRATSKGPDLRPWLGFEDLRLGFEDLGLGFEDLGLGFEDLGLEVAGGLD